MAGLALGAASAALGLWLGSGDGAIAAPEPTATTATTQPPDRIGRAVWVAPGETVLGPTVLVPQGFALAEGRLDFAYALHDIAPPAYGVFADDGAAIIAPEAWTLTTTGGEIAGSTVSKEARTAAFEVPDGFSLDQITGLRLDRHRIRLPVRHRLDIPLDDFADRVLQEGVTVGLDLVLPQSNNTIVRVRSHSDATDGFVLGGGAQTFVDEFADRPLIRGVGSGFTQVGFAENGVQLTYEGDVLPDPLPLLVMVRGWVGRDAPIDIDLSGVVDG